MIKVLLADDHALVRDGLRHILQSASGFEVAGEAWDGVTAIALIGCVAIMAARQEDSVMIRSPYDTNE